MRSAVTDHRFAWSYVRASQLGGTGLCIMSVEDRQQFENVRKASLPAGMEAVLAWSSSHRAYDDAEAATILITVPSSGTASRHTATLALSLCSKAR